MVAPTRTPQARGVKCDLCKSILATATWLDQTKLAKTIQEPQQVLKLVAQHEKTQCPCIPKSIENLLIGSTHFEVHRLVTRDLDARVHQAHTKHCQEANHRFRKEASSSSKQINDCQDNSNSESKFRVYIDENYSKYNEIIEYQIHHLCKAIDFWKHALEDQTNPFNDKLALRLNLTRHVIYSCYCFKYHKILDYQIRSCNLLHNLFRVAEGVTANAQIHASSLYIRTLIECNQIDQAKQIYKQTIKNNSNHEDRSAYENILLTCASCELTLSSASSEPDADIHRAFDDLSQMSVILVEDKLQHYYARLLAMSILVRYIHCYKSKSEICSEFYHIFRYLGAIIRRCYESSFELVLMLKETKKAKGILTNKSTNTDNQQSSQIPEVSWIKYAICDFVLDTFDLLTNFYLKSGQPECMELLYNTLNLIVHRNGSQYWQSRMLSIGSRLDEICDKFDCANSKLDSIANHIAANSHERFKATIQLGHEISKLTIGNYRNIVITKDKVSELLAKIRRAQAHRFAPISKTELYDCKADTFTTLDVQFKEHRCPIDLNNCDSVTRNMVLKLYQVAVINMLRSDRTAEAATLIKELGALLRDYSKQRQLEYYDNHTLLEILLAYARIDESDKYLVESISSSDNIFVELNDGIKSLESQLSLVTLSDTYETARSNFSSTYTNNSKPVKRASKQPSKLRKSTLSRLSLRGRVKSRIYDVAAKSEENLNDCQQPIRLYNAIDALVDFETLTLEEVLVAYVRNTEPNPDYNLYRRAHEMLLSLRIKDGNRTNEQLLYHFSECCTSNTMRYRWMLYEEQTTQPFEAKSASCVGHDQAHSLANRQVSFCSAINNIEKTTKMFVRSIAEQHRMVQSKYVVDHSTEIEHLLVAVFDHGSDEPIFAHVKRPICLSDDYFVDAKTPVTHRTFPNKFASKIEEAKATLFITNRTRSERRRELERDVEQILRDIEDDWLGPMKFLLCAPIQYDKESQAYKTFVTNVVGTICKLMKDYCCTSDWALRILIENAPLLNREEFCRAVSAIFSCNSRIGEVRECFDYWLKSIETLLAKSKAKNSEPATSKLAYLCSLQRGQVGLILDQRLEHIPFEALPVNGITKQGMFRVPSLRIFFLLQHNWIISGCPKIDINDAAYMLDPANNLCRTRERFEAKLREQTSWLGVIGQTPKPDDLETWLAHRQLYLYVGHGAGTAYYNKLSNGRGLGFMKRIKSVAIVMGCSSGRVLCEGPRLESFGINWLFLLRGAPSYVGLLWDVTDTDIDRFLDAFVSKWTGLQWLANSDAGSSLSVDTKSHAATLSDAIAQARQVCEYKFLVGSTPVVYGLPLQCAALKRSKNARTR